MLVALEPDMVKSLLWGIDDIDLHIPTQAAFVLLSYWMRKTGRGTKVSVDATKIRASPEMAAAALAAREYAQARTTMSGSQVMEMERLMTEAASKVEVETPGMAGDSDYIHRMLCDGPESAFGGVAAPDNGLVQHLDGSVTARKDHKDWMTHAESKETWDAHHAVMIATLAAQGKGAAIVQLTKFHAAVDSLARHDWPTAKSYLKAYFIANHNRIPVVVDPTAFAVANAALTVALVKKAGK